jgi:hypothetical protein
MSQKEIPKHEDSEIIEEHVVPGSSNGLIKIKIKERISRKKRKKRLSIGLKIFVLISAIILGFFLGTKIASRYISHWRKPHIQQPPEESQRLQAGEVFSIEQE